MNRFVMLGTVASVLAIAVAASADGHRDYRRTQSSSAAEDSGASAGSRPAGDQKTTEKPAWRNEMERKASDPNSQSIQDPHGKKKAAGVGGVRG